MATRKVPVTSVTPASKVMATSKAQQSRTRNLVMGIAAATPVGRAAKAAGTAAKAVSSTRKSNTLAKKYDNALKAASGTKSPRPYRDVVESVKVKPAAKPVGNPPNPSKSTEEMISSVSRGGIGRGSLGKAKTARKFSTPAGRGKMDARQPSRTPDPDARSVGPLSYRQIKINTDPTKPKGIFGPLKNKAAAANTPANRAKAQANTRGLKAANKPLSKGNKKLVTQIKQQTGYIAMDRRPTPPTVAAALKKGPKGSFITEAKKIAMQEARSEGPAKKISSAQKALNKKK